MTHDSDHTTVRSHERSSDFIGALDDAVRNNPIPAALVGIGILWLFAGGRNVMLGGASRTIFGGIGHRAQDAGGIAYLGARAAAGRVADGVGALAEGATEIGTHARATARAAAETVGTTIDKAGEMLGEAARRVDEGVRESRGTYNPSSATDPVGGAQGNEGGMQDFLADLFAKQPLMLGAVGIAIGAAVAASLPASESENRLMGDTADAVKGQAEKLWDQTKRRGADLASKGLKEAEAQGLTPEAAAQAARTIAAKVAGLAESTASGIVGRTRR
jgi:hypothetical protein